MKVDVVRAGPAVKATLESLYPLYLHDLSAWMRLEVDEQGRFLQPGPLDVWWERDVLHPFLIRAEGRLAGFALVCGPPHVTRGRDYRLNDFFILRGYRRRGVGRSAAMALFSRFAGLWEVGWAPENAPAAAFWRGVVAELTGGQFEEASVIESPDEGLPGLIFRAG